MKTTLCTPIGATIREDGEGKPPCIVGYGAVFFDPNTAGTEYRAQLWDGWTLIERIQPGAFDAALSADDDIVALWAHEHDKPLARRSRGTLRLSVDSRGLAYEIDPPDTTWGSDAVASIRRGDVGGSSFGFALTDGYSETLDRATKTIVRVIKNISRLYEVSPVAIPAYVATGANVRSADDADRLHELIRRSMDQTARTRAIVAIALATLGDEE